MSFCATCGRPRTGTAPFCAGCGARFADAKDASDQAGTPESGSAETRWDTRVELPGGQAPSVAAPTQPSPAFPPPPAADVPPTAAPFGSAPAGPGQYPGAMPNQPGFGPPPPSSPRRGGSGLLIGLVIVLVLAVGGGAFALVSALTKNKAAAPPSSPPASASSSPTGSATGSASSSASASPTASPTTGTSAVALGPGVAGNSAAQRVQALVERYFTAINTHDYAAYSSIHTASAQLSYSSFVTGYGTTTDSAEELVGISEAGAEELATVTFISHQSPARSVTGTSCTKWKITLYLLPQGNSYLITTTPPSYHATYAAC